MKDFAIIKRDGSKDRFSLDKIMNAIIKAFESVNEDVDLASVSKIVSHIDVFDGVTVENIQNQVEQALMREGYYNVAKSFIIYRQLHSEDRETLENSSSLPTIVTLPTLQPVRSTTPTPTWSTRTSLRSSASCLSRASSA